MYSLHDFSLTLNEVLISLEENELNPSKNKHEIQVTLLMQVRMVSMNKIQMTLIMKLQKRFCTCQDVYTGWANKMLPLFNHTQVFKCEFIQNFYSKICDKKH